MKKLFKWILISALVCLILLIACFIGLHFYVKSYIRKPEFSKMIISQMENTTHRKAEFKSIDYSIIPLSLLLEDVALKNKDNTGNFVSLKKLDIKINLLKGEITNIILDAPELNVRQFKDGSFDFSDLITVVQPSANLTAPAPVQENIPDKTKTEAKPFSLPVSLNIALIQIKNASLHYTREDKSGALKSFDIPNFDLAIKNISLERQIDLELKIKIGKGSTIAILTGLGPLKTLPPDIANLNLLLNGVVKIAITDLEAFIPKENMKGIPITNLDLTWDGKGTLATGFNFDCALTTPSLSGDNKVESALKTALNVDIPREVLNNILKGTISAEDIQKQIRLLFKGTLDLKAELVPSQILNLNCKGFQLDVHENLLKVEDLNFTHKDTDIHFKMDVKGLNPNTTRPKILMNLSSDTMVIHELLKAFKTQNQASETMPPLLSEIPAENSENRPVAAASAPAPAVQQELDLRKIPFLGKIILDAEVMGKKIIYEKNILTDFKTLLHLENGIITINPLSLNLFDGTVSDIAEGNLLACPVTYKSNFKIENLDINKACAANMKEANYFGKLTADFNAEGSGITQPNLKLYLLSKGNINLKDGKIISQGGSLEDKVYLGLDNPIILQAIPKLSAKVEKARANADKTTETRIKECLFSYHLKSGKMVLEGFQMGTPEYFLTAKGDIYPFDDKINMLARINFSEEVTKELTEGKDLSDKLPYENHGLIFPLTINGQLRSPTFLPDIAFLTRNLATQQLTKELSKLLGRKKGDMEDKGSDKNESHENALAESLVGLFNK